jgi:hypothetical protein
LLSIILPEEVVSLVRARFVVLIIPILLLTSAIIAQEPVGLLDSSRSSLAIADGAQPSDGTADYSGNGASFNVDFMGQFANGSSWSNSTTSLAEDLTPGTSFSAANGSTTVEWTAYVLISPPYNISSVNLTLTSIPTTWVLSDVLDSSLVSRYPSSGVDAASGEVNVSSSVIDVFGVWTFSFTDSNGATNLECGINAGGYATTRSYEVGDFASFRGTAPVTAGSRMRLYLTDPFGITQYVADQVQSGSYFEWTGISIQSDWPAGIWYADVDFNNTGGAYPTFVGKYQRSFNVTHDTSLSLRTPGDAVGDYLTERTMGELLYISVDLIDNDNSQPVLDAAVTLNWTDHGTPVTHTLADYGNGTYGIALNTTDLEFAGQWRINIDGSNDYYTAPPTLSIDLDLYNPTELTYKSVYSTPIGYDFTATLEFHDIYTGMPIAGASIEFGNGTAANVVSEANGEYNITVSSNLLTLGEHWYVFNASKPSSYVQMASVNVTFLLRAHLTAATVSGNLTIPFGFNTSLSVVLIDLDTGLDVGIGNVTLFSFTSSYGTQDYISPSSFDLVLNTKSWNVEQVSVTLSVMMSSGDYNAPSDYTFNIAVRRHYTLININGNLTKPYGLNTPLTVILLDMDTGAHLGIGNVSDFIFSSSYGTEFFSSPSSFGITMPTNTWSIGATNVTLTATLSGSDYLQPSGYLFEIVMRPHLTAVTVGGEFLIPYGANANVTVVLIDLDLGIEVPIGDVNSFSFSSGYPTQTVNNPASYDVLLSTSTWSLGTEAVTLSVDIASSIYADPINFGFDIQIRAHHTSLSINGNLTALHGFDTPLHVILLDIDTGASIDISNVSLIRYTSSYGTQNFFFPSDYDATLDTDSWGVGKVQVTLLVLLSVGHLENPDDFVFEITIRGHITSVSISANLTHAYGSDMPVSIHLVDVDTGMQVPIGDVGSFTFTSSYVPQILSSPSSFDVLLDTDAWIVDTTIVTLSVVLSNSNYTNPSDFVFSVIIRPHYTSVAITGNLTVPYGTNSSFTVVLLDLDTGLAVDVGSVAMLSFTSSYGTQDFTAPSSYDAALDTDSWNIGITNVTLSVSMAGTTFSNPSDFEFNVSVRTRRTAVYVHGELTTPYGMDTNLSVVLTDLDSGTEIDISDVDEFSFVSTYGTDTFSSPSSFNVTLITSSWSVSVVLVTLSVSFSVSQYSIPTNYVFEITIRNHITSAWVVGEFTAPSGEDTNVTVFVKDLDTDALVSVSEVASISFSSTYGTDVFNSPSSYSVILPTNSWLIGSWDVNLSISLSGSIYDDPANHSFIVVIRRHLTSVTVQGNLTTPYGIDTPLNVVLTDLDTGLVIDVSSVVSFNFSSSYGPEVFNSPSSYDILLDTDTWTVATTSVTLQLSMSGSIYDDPTDYVFDVIIRAHYTAASVLHDLQTPYGMDTDITVVLIDLDLGTQIEIGNVSLIEFVTGYGTEQFASPSSPDITIDTDAWSLGTESVTMTITMAGSIYSAPANYVFDIFIRKHHTSVTVSGNLIIPYSVDTQLTVVLTDLDTLSSIPIGDVTDFGFTSSYGLQVIAPTDYNVTLSTSTWIIGATLVTLNVNMDGGSFYFNPENFTFNIIVRRHFTAVSVSGEFVLPYGNDTHLSILILDLDTGSTFAISNVSSFSFDSTYGPQNFVSPSSYDVTLTTGSWSVGVTEVTFSVAFSSSILNTPDDLVFNVTMRAHYTSVVVKGSMTTLYGFDTPLTIEVTDLDTGLQVDIADISSFTFASIYGPQVLSTPASYDVILDTDGWSVDVVSVSLSVTIGGSVHFDPADYSFNVKISTHQTTLSVTGDLTIPHGEDVSLILQLIDSDLGSSVDIADVTWVFFTSAQGNQNVTAPASFSLTLGTSSWSLGITLVTVSVGISNPTYELPNSHAFNITIRMHYTSVSVSGDLETPLGENTSLSVVLIDLDTGLEVPVGSVDSLSFTSGYGPESFASPASYGLQLTTDTWGIGTTQVNLSVSLSGSIYENPANFTFSIDVRLRYTSATVSGTLVMPYAFDTNLTVIVSDLDSGTMVDEVNVVSLTFESAYGTQVFTQYNLTLATSTWLVGQTTVTLAVSLAGSDYADPTNYTFTLEIRPHTTAVSVIGVLIQPYGNETPLTVELIDLDTMNQIAISNITSFTFDSTFGPQNFVSPTSYDVVLATDTWSVGVIEVTLSVLFSTSNLNVPDDFTFNVTLRAHYTSITVLGSLTSLYGFDTPLTVEVTDLDTGLLVDIADISAFNFTSIHGSQTFSSLSSYDVTLDTDTWQVGTVPISLTVTIGGLVHYAPAPYSFDLSITTHETIASVSGDFTVPHGEDVTLTVLLIDTDLGIPLDISDVVWIFFASIQGNQNETALTGFGVTLATSSWPLGITPVTVSVGLSSTVYELPDSYEFNVTIRIHFTAVSVSGDLETPRGENTPLDVVLIDLDTGLEVPIGAVSNFAFTSEYGTEPFASPASYGLQLTTDTWGVGSREVNLTVSLAGSIYENPSEFTFNINIRLRYTSVSVNGNLVVPYAFDTNLTVIILDLDSGSIVDEVNVDSLTFDSVYGTPVFTTYDLILDTSGWNIGLTTVTLAVSLAGSDYANPANHTFTLEIRPHMTAVSVKGVVIQPYGNQTPLSVVLIDLDTMNPIGITNVTSFTFDSSYGPQSMPSPSGYDVTLYTSLWSVGTTSVTLSVVIATSYYSVPQSHVFQITIRSLRIQLYHEPGDLIFPNGDDFQLILGVKVTEPGPSYNDSLTGLLQSEFSVSGYAISITEIEPGRYRLIIDESSFTQGNYTIDIVIDPSDSRYSTDLLSVYFMYTPARSFLSSPNYPQVTTPYGADVNITLEYTDVDRGVGITGATMTPEGISITYSEHPIIQGTYIVTLIVTSLETGAYSFNITASAADYESKMLSFTLLVRVVYTYAIPTVAALDIPVGNSPVFYVEYWDIDHDISVSNETPFLVAGTWSSFTVEYEPGAPRPRYKITFITFDDTPLEQNRVVTFNFSKGANYQTGVFTVTVTIRTHHTDFRLVSAVEPTSYKALLNISVYYGDLDNLAGIRDSKVTHYVEGESGFLTSTLFNDTLPGYYIVQINATEFGSLGLQDLEIFFNWTGVIQKYHNLSLLVSVNIIGAESSYALLSASEPTPYLDNMSYVFLYKDLHTGQGITNISYGGGNVHIYVSFQEVVVDIGQLTIWEVDPILYPGRYSLEFNTTIFGLVGALHMEVYINWTSGAEPYYTNRTDIITARILPRDTLVSIIPPSPTPYGENATFSFTFDDVTGGLSESIHYTANMIVYLNISDFTMSYNSITRIFTVSFNTSQLVADSVGQVPFALGVEWHGEPFYANRTDRVIFVSIIQRLTILEYTSPPPSPYNDVVTFTVTWTDVTGAIPHGVIGAILTLYNGSSGPEINSLYYSWLDLNDGRYRISLNSSYAGMLGTHDLNVTLTTSLFYLANRTAIQSFVVGPRSTFLSSEPVGRIAYNTSIAIILYYQDLVNLAMIGNATDLVSIECLNGSSWVFTSSWVALNEYYLITMQTASHPELEVNTPYVLQFNMSYADTPPYYESADAFVRIQFRNRASSIELNEAPQPAPYGDSVNFSISYLDLDIYGGILGASISVRKSGVPLVFGTDYTVTSQVGGLYLLSIDTVALDGIVGTPITVYANWSLTAPYYANATLNIVLTTILRYTNLEIVAPPSQTRFLDLVKFTVSVVDLGTGSTISIPLSYFKLFNGSTIELLAPQFSIQDIGGNLYEITINSTILSSRLVTNHELIVSVEFPFAIPYYRSDNTTARVSTTNRIGSVAVGQVQSTPLGANMTLGFSFLDESSGTGVENAIILFDCLNVSGLVQGTDFWITEDQGVYVVSVDTNSLGVVGTYQFSLSVQWDPLRQPFYLNTTTLTLTGSVRLTDTLLTSDAPTPYTVPYTDNVSIIVTFTDLDNTVGIEGAGSAIRINYTATGAIPATWDYEVVSPGRYRIIINTTDAGAPGIKTMQISIDYYPYRLAWVQLSFQVRLRDGVLTADVSDAYAGETVTVLVNLTDSDAYGAPIDGATLNFTWDDPHTVIPLGDGLYEILLNTSSKNQDIYTIFIEASATDFRILPLAIDFELYALTTKVVTQEVAPASWGDSVTISAIFNDTINNELILDATLSFTWDRNSYTMNESTPGYYTAELDTSLVDASTYYIVIRANKTNYLSSFAQITLVVDSLDIEVKLVNGIFATVSRGEKVNMTVFLNDTYNNQPLLGANVTVYWTFNESREAALIELGNGYYQFFIETDDSESAQSYQAIVNVLKPNYRAISEVLTLGIRQTETAVWFDAVSQGYEDLIFNWSQVIRIGVYVVAPELNVTNDDYYLENCTVTWKSGSYNGNLTFDGSKFYFDFNTTEYPAQTYSFRITAVPKELAFSLSGNGTIIIVQTIQTALIQPENVNQIWGWTGWFNFTYWDVYHDVGIDDIAYGRSVYALYSWPGGSGTPFYFGNGIYGVFIDTSQSVPRSDPYTIVIEFQLDNFVPQLGRFNLIISPIPAEIEASAPPLNQIDNSTINLRVPWGDTITVGLRYATVGINTTHTPFVGGIANATIDSATFRAPDWSIGYREDFTLLEIGDGNYSFAFNTSLWSVSGIPYQFSVYLSYGNRTDALIVISIQVINVPTSLTIDGPSSFSIVREEIYRFTVHYADEWEGHGGVGIEGATHEHTGIDDIRIEIIDVGGGDYEVTVFGEMLNETGGFFTITFSQKNHVNQTTIDISYRITPNETDILIINLRNYGLPFGILIFIFGVIYNRVLKLPKRVRQMRKMINAVRKGKVPKPVDDVFSRREMVANLFDDTMKALEITTTPERVPEYGIIVDVPEMGELLIQLAILTRLSAEELEDFRRDISKMRVSEQAAFVKEVINQEALRVARLDRRPYEEVLEDIATQARRRLIGDDIIAMAEIDSSMLDPEPLVLTEEKPKIEFDEPPSEADEPAEPKEDEPPVIVREYMKAYEIEELRIELEARGMPRDEVMVILEQAKTLPRELVDDLIKSLVGEKKED